MRVRCMRGVLHCIHKPMEIVCIQYDVIPWAKTIKKNTNSTQSKYQTYNARAYDVTSFLSADCEIHARDLFIVLGPCLCIPCMLHMCLLRSGIQMPSHCISDMVAASQQNEGDVT